MRKCQGQTVHRDEEIYTRTSGFKGKREGHNEEEQIRRSYTKIYILCSCVIGEYLSPPAEESVSFAIMRGETLIVRA